MAVDISEIVRVTEGAGYKTEVTNDGVVCVISDDVVVYRVRPIPDGNHKNMVEVVFCKHLDKTVLSYARYLMFIEA